MEIGTVFAVIFTVILISALIIFGFSFIGQLLQQQELQQIGETLDSFQATLNDLYYTSGAGSTTSYTLRIPASSTFCLVKPWDPSPRIQNGWDPGFGVEGFIIDNGYNLWIYYQSGASELGKTINHMNVSESFGNFCADNGAQLRLENIGLWVEVSIKQ